MSEKFTRSRQRPCPWNVDLPNATPIPPQREGREGKGFLPWTLAALRLLLHGSGDVSPVLCTPGNAEPPSLCFNRAASGTHDLNGARKD